MTWLEFETDVQSRFTEIESVKQSILQKIDHFENSVYCILGHDKVPFELCQEISNLKQDCEAIGDKMGRQWREWYEGEINRLNRGCSTEEIIKIRKANFDRFNICNNM